MTVNTAAIRFTKEKVNTSIIDLGFNRCCPVSHPLLEVFFVNPHISTGERYESDLSVLLPVLHCSHRHFKTGSNIFYGKHWLHRAWKYFSSSISSEVIPGRAAK